MSLTNDITCNMRFYFGLHGFWHKTFLSILLSNVDTLQHIAYFTGNVKDFYINIKVK